MKKTWIYLLLLALLALIIVIVTVDLKATKVGNMPGNKYELDTDSLKDGDGYEVSWTESKQLKLNAEEVYGIDVRDDKIYVAYDKVLQVLTMRGESLKTFDTEGAVRTIKAGPDESVFVVHSNFFVQLDSNGMPNYKSDEMDEKAVFTSLAFHGEKIFVADAGNRKVLIFNIYGEKTGEFKGVYKSDNESKGFIIPSAYFDLVVNQEGELWVVNPGLHTLQHYSVEGDLINYWEKAGNNIEGFIGCCNPAQMTVMPDGRFVTGEKKMPRIKVYTKTGELESVVALPESFKEKGKAPDLAIWDRTIYALDFDRKMIRVFEKKSDE